MKLKRINVLYFSPTGGTEKIARLAAGELAAKLGVEQTFIDFTRPPSPSAFLATAAPMRLCGS